MVLADEVTPEGVGLVSPCRPEVGELRRDTDRVVQNLANGPPSLADIAAVRHARGNDVKLQFECSHRVPKPGPGRTIRGSHNAVDERTPGTRCGAGSGGSLGVNDIDSRTTIGYVMNRMIDDRSDPYQRGASIVMATYASLASAP